MDFLGIGPGELIVILVVALIFVGPERLPRLAADIARVIREIRKYTSGLAEEFNEVVKDFEKDTEGERNTWKEIGEGLTGATKSVTDTVRAARIDAQGKGRAVVPPAGQGEPASKPTDVTVRDTPVRWIDIPSPSASADGGVPVLTSTPGRFCSECGGQQAADRKFCPHCGAAVTGVAER